MASPDPGPGSAPDPLPHPLAEAPEHEVIGGREALGARVNVGHPGRQHTLLDEHLPMDHHLSRVYRFGAGVAGLALLAFGILGLIDRVGFFDTQGDRTLGLSTNGALSVLSIVVGALLFYGMVRGGNFASSLNMILGVAFLLSGFVNLALLETSWNFLAFRMQNVLFSFAMGLVLLVFGMYGRVGSKLPHDNPYWRTRNPERAAYEEKGGAAPADADTESGSGARVGGGAAPVSGGGPPSVRRLR